jgi:hypothetical protein
MDVRYSAAVGEKQTSKVRARDDTNDPRRTYPRGRSKKVGQLAETKARRATTGLPFWGARFTLLIASVVEMQTTDLLTGPILISGQK